MSGCFMGFCLRLQFPECSTLKDRRSRVESIVHTAKNRHGFSAADISDPLKIDYAEVGLAAVGKNENEIRGRLDRVLAAADRAGEMTVLAIEELEMTEDR